MNMAYRTLDWGQPLTPAEVGQRVRAYLLTMPPPIVSALRDKHRVVVHPVVLDAIELDGEALRPIVYFREMPPADGPVRIPRMLCCGIPLTDDPSLRYDEVRLRQEVPL